MKIGARSSMAELRAYTSAVPGSNPGGRTERSEGDRLDENLFYLRGGEY